MAEAACLAAIEGWYTLDPQQPRLIGSRCKSCGSFFFPAEKRFCRNPDCESTSFEESPLSPTGRVWSFTDAQYQPPEPYVSPEPFEPFAIVAVELDEQKLIVLGQAARGIGVGELRVGMRVRLVLEPLYTDEKGGHLVWKWQPADSSVQTNRGASTNASSAGASSASAPSASASSANASSAGRSSASGDSAQESSR